MGNYNFVTATIKNTTPEEIAGYLTKITGHLCTVSKNKDGDRNIISMFPYYMFMLREEDKDISLMSSVKWQSYERGHKEKLEFWAIEKLAEAMGNSVLEYVAEEGCTPHPKAVDGKYREEYAPKQRLPIKADMVAYDDPAAGIWATIAIQIAKDQKGVQCLFTNNDLNNFLKSDVYAKYKHLECSDSANDRLKYASIVMFCLRANKTEGFDIRDLYTHTQRTREYSLTIPQADYLVGLQDFIAKRTPQLKTAADTFFKVHKMAAVLNGISAYGKQNIVDVSSSDYHISFNNYVAGFVKEYGQVLNDEKIGIFIENNDISFEYCNDVTGEVFKSSDLEQVLNKVENPDLIAKITGYYKEKETGSYKQSFKFNRGLADPCFGEKINHIAVEYGAKYLVFSTEMKERFETKMNIQKEDRDRQRGFIPETAKVYLNVPYADKDAAKERGARWDNDAKKWYCDRESLEKFIRWLPSDAAIPKKPEIKTSPIEVPPVDIEAMKSKPIEEAEKTFTKKVPTIKVPNFVNIAEGLKDILEEEEIQTTKFEKTPFEAKVPEKEVPVAATPVVTPKIPKIPKIPKLPKIKKQDERV